MEQEQEVSKKTYERQAFSDELNLVAQEITEWSKGKGFWDTPQAVIYAMGDSAEVRTYLTGQRKSQKLMLIVSELSECLEGLRKPTEGKAGFTNEEEEIADTMIRLLDYCGYYRLRIGETIAAKMRINEGRPHQHGKAF